LVPPDRVAAAPLGHRRARCAVDPAGRLGRTGTARPRRAGSPARPPARPRRGAGAVKRRLEALAAGGPLLPLIVLVGLNFMDEVDRDAFNVLIPNIRDALH